MKNLSKLIPMLLLSVALTSCSISKMTNRQYDRVTHNQIFDVVIVPGAPIEEGGLSGILSARILWSKYLYDQGIAKHIIYSGAAVSSPYVEGLAMRSHAIKIGMPADKVFAETKAEHSTENIYYSVQMARKMGFQKIAIATDPVQTFMIHSFRKKYLPFVEVVPIVFDKVFKSKEEYKKLTPVEANEAHLDEREFIPLHNRESFFKRFAGTRGKNIAYDPASVAPLDDTKILVTLDTLSVK